MIRADQWAADADERELLADERERLADEREALADERERLADRHDHGLDRREAEGWAQQSGRDRDRAAEVAATHSAIDRAQSAMRRAEAQLHRAHQTVARVQAQIARDAAATDRAEAVKQSRRTGDAEEQAWLADRRDFVSAERQNLADERERVADERDAIGDLRERLADEREHEALDREERLDQRHRDHGGALTRPASFDDSTLAELRAKAKRERKSATAQRHVTAAARAQAASSWGPETYGPMLLASFAQLAHQLFGTDDLADALPQVLKHTVGAVVGCDWASITLWRREHAVDTLASNSIAAELDDLQFGTGLGPSAEALHSRHPMYVPNLVDSPRWPVLAATAAQLGVSSALSHGLFIHHGAQWSALGTLTLYSATPDAFSDEDHDFAAILASFIAVTAAIAQRRDDVERREAALHRGLSTRDVIGQAKGILMERQKLSAGDAFDLLRRASQRLNRKLAEVAEHLANTGELPT